MNNPYTPNTIPALLGAPTAQFVSADWHDRVDLALDDFRRRPTSPNAAYDILALWAFAKRLHPSLCATNETLESLVRVNADQLVQQATAIATPLRWLEACKDMEDDIGPYEAHIPTLLRQIDNAQLVIYAARALGAPNMRLEDEIGACVEWVADNAECWLGACALIKVTGESFRPDLDEYDPELALTGELWVVLLDSWENALKALRYENVRPLSRDDVLKLLKHA